MKTNIKFGVKVADDDEREKIYRLRYLVYALELGQHEENEKKILKDPIDEINRYIIVKNGKEIAGFVSITPPGNAYGLDKYMARTEFPHIYDNMYEGRLFTVLKPYRGTNVALLLFFAVLRWAEHHGGDRIMTIGRKDIVPMYKKAGLTDLGREIKSGKVTFHLMYGNIKTIRNRIGIYEKIFARLVNNLNWQLDFPAIKPCSCYHGGDFFNYIGTAFDNLYRKNEIINADVLDAWFPPFTPRELFENLPWLMNTSPPVDASGLVKTIASVQNIDEQNILRNNLRSFLFWL